MGEKQLEIPDKTRNNTFNIDKKFDYSTVRGMVIQFLEKSVREELNRHIGSINLHKIGMVCTASIKDDKSVRLEVHHAKTFDEICKENNITTALLHDSKIS